MNNNNLETSVEKSPENLVGTVGKRAQSEQRHKDSIAESRDYPEKDSSVVHTICLLGRITVAAINFRNSQVNPSPAAAPC